MYVTEKNKGDGNMKCEIIRDLLPLYIDNICSKESRILIEDHLHDCTECHKLFEELTKNIEVENNEDDEINVHIQEKDLLLKAKRSIRFEFIKKIFKVIYKLVIGLNILAIIIGYISIKIGYDLEYPRFYFGSLGIKTYILLLCVFLFPLINGFIGMFIINKINYIKRYSWKIILNSIVLVVSIVLSLISGFIMFTVIPPLESFTDSPQNYLVVGRDMEKFENIYQNFFPKEIPNDAEDISYSYRKYNGLFETTGVICASWSLPIETYEHYKQIIETNSEMVALEGNKYEIYLRGENYPYGLKLNFEYNDDKRELKYIALIERNE